MLRATVAMLAIVAALLSSSCGAGSRSAKEAKRTIAATGAVDLDPLTPAETLLLVEIVRVEASPCAKDLSLIESLASPAPCKKALRALDFIYQRILEGYGREDVLDQYVARFKSPRVLGIQTEGCPEMGPSEARVTIVVFSDFQCPFCRKAAATLAEAREKRPDDVRVVYKYFPLTSIHEEAMNAAVAAAAAHLQGRFWEMHDALFARQDDLGTEAIEEAAGEAGLDMERWAEDIESPDVLDIVNRDVKEAQDLGVEGTPSIFVNGMEYGEPLKYLDQVIEERLMEATDPS